MSLPPNFNGMGSPFYVVHLNGQPGNNGGLAGNGAGGQGTGGSGEGSQGTCVGGTGGETPECGPCEDNGVPANARTCLARGTLIGLPGGDTKPIELLESGDAIAGIDCSGKPTEQVVKRVTRHEAECVEVSFGEERVICTLSHAFIGKGITELFASQLRPGSEVLSVDGSLQKATGIAAAGIREVFDIEVSPNHMYVANGFVHHNKVECAQVISYE